MALMDAHVGRITLSDSQFANMTGGKDGEIHRYCVEGGRMAAQLARQRAPKRTGHMSRTIRNRTVRANATSTHVQIRCTAPYAGYVHDGTAPIYGEMVLYAGVIARPQTRSNMAAFGSKGDWSHTIGWHIWRVAGQASQPFMTQALDAWVMFERSKGVIR